jgi:hypothetical protein
MLFLVVEKRRALLLNKLTFFETNIWSLPKFCFFIKAEGEKKNKIVAKEISTQVTKAS